MPVSPGFGRLMWEDQELEANLDYISCLKKPNQPSKQVLRDCFYCYLAISSSRQDKVIHNNPYLF